MKKATTMGLLLALTVVLSGCGSQEEKLAGLAADLLCLAEKSFTEIMAITDPVEMEKKSAELETQAKKLMEDAGYANEDEAQKAWEAVKDKEAFKKNVEKMAKEKCNASDFLIQGFNSSMDESTPQ